MKRLIQFTLVIGGIYVIPAIYLISTNLLPGTTNEIVIMASLAIIMAVAWKKWKYAIPYHFKSLDMPDSYLIGQMITVGIYAMILLFIDKHGNHIQIPSYWLIATGTFILLMDNIIMERRNLWTERLFEATTVIFLLSMFQNHDSQYIWLISIPYIGMMLKISDDKELFASKNSDWVITLAVLLTCATLTVIQFWPHIYYFLTYEIWGIGLWMIGATAITIWIVIAAIRWEKNRRLANKKAIEEQLAKEKKQKEEELQKAALRQANTARLETLLKEYQQRQDWKVAIEIISLSELLNLSLENKFKNLLIDMNLKDLVIVTEAKKQLVWNDKQLRMVMKTIDDLAYHGYNDKILRKILHQYREFEKFIDHYKGYIGQEQLQSRLCTYFSNVNSLNAMI